MEYAMVADGCHNDLHGEIGFMNVLSSTLGARPMSLPLER